MTTPKKSLTCAALLARALLAMLALANLALVRAHADAAAVVTLSAPPERVAAGETVALSVNILDIENLYGIELHAQFDAQKLQVLPDAGGKAATPGSLMGHDFVAVNAFDNTAGTIDYAAVQMNPRAPAGGSGALLTIRFKTLAAGNAPVNLTSLILSDIDGVPLAATTANTVIAILGDGATPPPATPAPGITALAPPAAAPVADTPAPAAATATQAPATTEPIKPRATATSIAAAIPVQPARAATAISVPVATLTATPAQIIVDAPGAKLATPGAQPTAAALPTAARVARAVGAPVAQPPALPKAPSRVNPASVASPGMKNISLLVGGAMSLLIAAAAWLEWRRRAPRS